MEHVPLVTVGVLTYNRAWSLPKVLDSLKALDYEKKAMRLVFVDKNSTDGTRKMIDDFASENRGSYESVQVVASDAGIPGARNECLARAEGSRYLFFLDSDVVPGPEALKRLLSNMMGDRVGIASLPYDSENSRGKLGPLVNAFNTPPGLAEAWKVAAGCTLVSMELVKKVGGFNERLRVLEDGEYCYRARLAGYRILCDFRYPAGHQKAIKMGTTSYLGFVKDSARFYVEMARDGSWIYRGRYLLSVALLASFISLLVNFGWVTAALFMVFVALALGLNSSDRLWGDGSTIKLAYKPVMGAVITLATIAISIYTVRVILARPSER